MILSVSRRTDIPSFYAEWFMNRIRDNYVCVRNPYNANQISKIKLTSNNVDCIVFWTKDPHNLMEYLEELDGLGYKYYFQFTITPYGKEIENNIRDKNEIIKTFIELSNKIGKEKVILRYDPIIITEKYTEEYHIKAFRRLCNKISKYTNRIVFSFIDDYKKVARNMKHIDIQLLSNDDMCRISFKLAEIANNYNISLETCAEDLNNCNIKPTSCIDGDLIEKIIGCSIKNKNLKDGNRELCGCMKCIDIGDYDTCIHNCLYCYANVNKSKANQNYDKHNPKSSILIGEIDEKLVTERKDVGSYKILEEQISLFR